MALITATTILTSLSLFHLTLAYYFLTSPSTIADHNLVYIIGEAMGLVRLTLKFDKQHLSLFPYPVLDPQPNFSCFAPPTVQFSISPISFSLRPSHTSGSPRNVSTILNSSPLNSPTQQPSSPTPHPPPSSPLSSPSSPSPT